jgi:chromosomal replication initiation ATPase DnaA
VRTQKAVAIPNPRKLAISDSDRISAREIIIAAAKEFGVLPFEITSPTHERRVVLARRVAMWLMHERGWSSTKIGQIADKDHSTVLTALNDLRARRAGDAVLDERVKSLSGRLACGQNGSINQSGNQGEAAENG